MPAEWTGDGEEDHAIRAVIGLLGAVSVCPECKVAGMSCDEERCCSACGTDIIVCDDTYSAELLLAALNVNEKENERG